MADQDTNGKVAQALIGALRQEFDSFRLEIKGELQPLIKQVERHEEMKQAHCHELFNDRGSRVQALEFDVAELKTRAATFDARKWAIVVLLISCVLGFGSSVLGNVLLRH